MPTTIMSTPDVRVIQFICRFMRPKKSRNRSTATAASRNGTARPSEYAEQQQTPRDTSACVAAYVRMLPRIGPMHGVQPAPNAIPTSSVPR